MPDISMCDFPTCPLSLRCYRHPNSGTKPSFRQSWMSFAGGNDCPDFWPRTPAPERDQSRPFPVPKERSK